MFARPGLCGMGIGRLGLVAASRNAFSPLSLFAASEPGAFYDPSDMSTLFQDSAGTVPVTAVEQPVGRILDKSGRGNHATQATTTKRPVLSRLVNLLNKTAAGATWQATAKTEIPNYFGEDVGFSLYQDGVYYGDSPCLVGTVSVSAGAKLTATVLIDMSTVTGNAVTVGLLCFYQGGGAGLARAVLTRAGAVSVGYVYNITEVEVAGVLLYGSVYRISVSARLSQASASIRIYCEATDLASAVWGHPQITYASDAHLPYQRVNTATDYDADPAKFPAYLRFDGVDDAMQTGNIDFTGTDKMTVWAGVTPGSVAANAMLLELSDISNTNDGSFKLLVPETYGDPVISSSSRGTSANASDQGVFSTTISTASPLVISTAHDISGDRTTLSVNGVAYSPAIGDKGAGDFGNYPLYIGARAGTSLYFNGHLGCLIIRGAYSTESQIEATELYMKKKVGMP